YAGQQPGGGDDIETIFEELHRIGRTATRFEFPQAVPRFVEAVDRPLIVCGEDVLAVLGCGARKDRSVALINRAYIAFLSEAVNFVVGRACIDGRFFLPTEENLTVGRLLPYHPTVFPIVHRHAFGVAVIDAYLVATHHPSGFAFALLRPLRLVFVIDYGNVAFG